jgi:hypothetical protein
MSLCDDIIEHIKWLQGRIDLIREMEAVELVLIKESEASESEDSVKSLIEEYQADILHYYASFIPPFEDELCRSDEYLEIFLPIEKKLSEIKSQVIELDILFRKEKIPFPIPWHQHRLTHMYMSPGMQLKMADIPEPLLYEAAKDLLGWTTDHEIMFDKIKTFVSKPKLPRRKGTVPSPEETEITKLCLRFTYIHILQCIGYEYETGKVAKRSYDKEDDDDDDGNYSEDIYDSDEEKCDDLINIDIFYSLYMNIEAFNSGLKKSKQVKSYQRSSKSKFPNTADVVITSFIKKLKIFYNACAKQTYESLCEADKLKLVYIYDKMNMQIKRYLFGF